MPWQPLLLLTCIGHRQDPWASVLVLEVLILWEHMMQQQGASHSQEDVMPCCAASHHTYQRQQDMKEAAGLLLKAISIQIELSSLWEYGVLSVLTQEMCGCSVDTGNVWLLHQQAAASTGCCIKRYKSKQPPDSQGTCCRRCSCRQCL
jgi:hypothetical protein